LPPGPPPEFQLNQLQQAYLDQVLDAWEYSSSKVNSFSCPFERWVFNGLDNNRIPFSKDKGNLSYHRPDKGSFEITEIKQWAANPQQAPPPAAQQGNWVVNPQAFGDHWVCDGQYIYEFRPNQKQLVVTPIPPEMQGKAIVDGPLPFLFGAEAAKLKARYWLRIHGQPNKEELWVVAAPKNQVDAANFQSVVLILDREKVLPRAMRVHQPGGTHVDYIFEFASATINGTIDQLFNSRFIAPRTPWGWQRIDQPLPGPGPQQPPPPRQAEVPAVVQ
jgi:TIGR03009 family protein